MVRTARLPDLKIRTSLHQMFCYTQLSIKSQAESLPQPRSCNGRNGAKAKANAPKGRLMNPDFSIENHGTIFLFRMSTRRAVKWVSENVQSGTCEKIRICFWRLTKIPFPRPFRKIACIAFYCDLFRHIRSRLLANQFFHRFQTERFPLQFGFIEEVARWRVTRL